MRRLRLSSLGLLGLVFMLGAVSASSAAPPPAWAPAIEVPGTAALNDYGDANTSSVSCATTGNCAAGGYYADNSGRYQAFVADETNGSWGNAIEVPGTATLNGGGSAFVNVVSCATAGNCTAGGTYTDSHFFVQVFVAEETNGSWGNAIEVPGSPTLNIGDGKLNSVSCVTPGNCTVGGFYHDVSHRVHAWVDDETNGSWGNAIEVPGIAILNTSGDSTVRTISCATAHNCVAGGYYNAGSGHGQAWVADETNGTWSNAIQVPGTAALNKGGAAVRWVSCPTAGNCTSGGYYADVSGHTQAFVTDETNGTWGNAIEVPGTAALNSGGDARVTSVSCTAAGNCAAAGHYYDGSGLEQAFVVDETNGTWGNAIEAPGTATLNGGGSAELASVSCTAAGRCTAGGYYTDGWGDSEALVVSETNGSWHTAIELPGTESLNIYGYAFVNSISCTTGDNCAAGGRYADDWGSQAFVADSAALGATTLAAASAGGIYGGTTTLSATLTSGGNPVPGETVSFTLHGTSVGSATTDGNGLATLPNVSMSGVDAGSYPTGVAASFNGDGNPGSASNGSNTLTIVYPTAIVGLSSVTVKTTQGKIDSYDSSAGPYGPSNHGNAAFVISNGPLSYAGVALSGSTKSTQGSVTVATTASVSGDVTAGTTASIKGTVGGIVKQNAPAGPLSGPAVSACAPYSAQTGISGGTFSYSASTGNLTVKMGTVKLANGTYCFNNISLATGTKLVVNGPVTIHLTGRIIGPYGHILNNTNLPANLHILTSYVGTGSLAIAGGAHAYMMILAPGATVSIPTGSFFGRVFAGKLSLAGGAMFHLDTH